MTELRYEDVQRAVQAATQNLQNQVNDMRNMVVTINNQVSRVDDSEYKIDDLARQLNQLNQTMIQINNQMQTVVAQMQSMQAVPGVVNDLHYRIEAIERFANDMSNYLHVKQAQEEEDRNFRNAG